MVIWLIGLSGSGKTTVGKVLYAKMKADAPGTVFLDGDELREAIGKDLGYTVEARRTSEERTSRLCKLLADQDINVVCPKLSNDPATRAWNRKHIRGYVEVYMKVDVPVLRKRDAKGLYKRFDNGDITHVVGMDIPFIEPDADAIVVPNGGDRTPEAVATSILKAIGWQGRKAKRIKKGSD